MSFDPDVEVLIEPDAFIDWQASDLVNDLEPWKGACSAAVLEVVLPLVVMDDVFSLGICSILRVSFNHL